MEHLEAGLHPSTCELRGGVRPRPRKEDQNKKKGMERWTLKLGRKYRAFFDVDESSVVLREVCCCGHNNIVTNNKLEKVTCFLINNNKPTNKCND
jgi:hypothetical protein